MSVPKKRTVSYYRRTSRAFESALGYDPYQRPHDPPVLTAFAWSLAAGRVPESFPGVAVPAESDALL